MGVDKNAKQRLVSLPYHVLAQQVKTDDQERYDEIIKVMDWLYDFGPASCDWFVFSEEDGFHVARERNYLKPKPTFQYTFAFRHRHDAIIFKLVWNKLITSP